MLGKWKLSRKIGALILINIVVIAALIGIAYRSMSRIHRQVEEISDSYFPVVEAINTFVSTQLKEKAVVEEAIRFRLQDDREHSNRAIDRFWEMNLQDGAGLEAARERAVSARDRATTASAASDFAAILGSLDRIVEAHEGYESTAEEVFAALRRDDVAGAIQAGAGLTQYGDSLVEETDALNAQVLDLTRGAALQAERDEQTAIRVLIIFGILASLVAALIGIGISRSVIRSLRDATTKLREMNAAMNASIQQQRATTSETASAVSQTTSTVEELRQTAESAAQKSETVAERSEETLSSSGEVRDAIRHGIEAMQQIRAEVEDIAQSILGLSEKGIQIGEIVGTVNAIAEQSNLLAVNASIEAAKAGDHGKGFSVVATEVRALAERSKEATEQIRMILAETQKASNAAVMVTEQGSKRVVEAAALIDELGVVFDRMNEAIEKSADSGRQIALTASQQLAGVQQITGAMQSIEQATSDSAAGAAQLESAAIAVNESADTLTGIIEGAIRRMTASEGGSLRGVTQRAG